MYQLTIAAFFRAARMRPRDSASTTRCLRSRFAMPRWQRACELDYRVFDNGRYFLVFTSSFSFATARTRLASEPAVAYTAFDLRVGAPGACSW
jgi:hypothetical protein